MKKQHQLPVFEVVDIEQAMEIFFVASGPAQSRFSVKAQPTQQQDEALANGAAGYDDQVIDLNW